MVVSDTGTELTSTAILRWSQDRQVEWHFIAPGKPQQDAFVESFNGRRNQHGGFATAKRSEVRASDGANP